jgi:hypothetical protein
MMPSLIQNTTPLTAGEEWVSNVFSINRATQITGSVFADVSGTLYVDQGGDGVNWDTTTQYVVPVSNGVAIEDALLNQYFQIRYINDLTDQVSFRLFIDARDPYGDFLIPSEPPSSGGAWIVLFKNHSTEHYSVVGRFDGTDGWNVNGNAAVFQNKSGQYASFLVSEAVVTLETLQTVTEHGPASF